MENSTLAENQKVITVRKANYFVLLLPIGFLLFSIWALISMASPEPEYTSRIQETNSQETSLYKVILYGLFEVAVLGAVAQNAHKNKRLSAENISAITFATSYLVAEVSNYLQLAPAHWSRLLSLVLLNISIILIIITLLQDKSFAGYSMYQNKKVIIR